MKIVNLTPHIVRLNSGREFPPSGVVARISTSYAPIEQVDGIPFTRTSWGAAVNLPPPQGRAGLERSLLYQN